ncbi:hypothetical protein BC332_19692 [Capsicum chinense]|nr:hypothetical protein BC332_19692 [Capsicum chinense]
MEGSIDIDTLELDERQPATFSTSLRPEVIQKLFIDGEWREPVKKSNPATEETIGDIPAATVEDVDIPVKAARRALRRDDWGSTTGAQRAKYLRAIAAKIAFTGSGPIGVKIVTAAAQLVKSVILELGGKSPIVVFDDIHDLDIAVEWTLFGCFWTNGQICSATSRLILHETIYFYFRIIFYYMNVVHDYQIDRERPGPSRFGNAHHGQGPDSCRDKLGIRARLMVPGCLQNRVG